MEENVFFHLTFFLFYSLICGKIINDWVKTENVYATFITEQ